LETFDRYGAAIDAQGRGAGHVNRYIVSRAWHNVSTPVQWIIPRDAIATSVPTDGRKQAAIFERFDPQSAHIETAAAPNETLLPITAAASVRVFVPAI